MNRRDVAAASLSLLEQKLADTTDINDRVSLMDDIEAKQCEIQRLLDQLGGGDFSEKRIQHQLPQLNRERLVIAIPRGHCELL